MFQKELPVMTLLVLVCLSPISSANPLASPDDFMIDYNNMMTTIEFSRCSRRACAPSITIVNDLQVENVEFFNLLLQSDNPGLVQPHPSTAVVNILDDSESL